MQKLKGYRPLLSPHPSKLNVAYRGTVGSALRASLYVSSDVVDGSRPGSWLE